MEDYQQRVIIEKNELRIKLNALSKFIGCGLTLSDDDFSNLNSYDQGLLRRQEYLMREYIMILLERIDTF